MTFTKLEPTAKYAYSISEKFMQKYGRISGLAELYWQYHLTIEEFETILDILLKKEKIDEWEKERILKEIA